MSWVVLKFGGSSLSINGYNIILNKIKEVSKKHKVVIVLSAINNVTNLLINSSKENNNYDKIFNIHNDAISGLEIDIEQINSKLFKLKNYLDNDTNKIESISYGERLSTLILYELLLKNNLDINLIQADEFIFSNDNNKENSIYLDSSFEGSYEKFNKLIDKDIIITQGFIAGTPDNKTCLLGRGGSDTSAALIANMLNAKNLQIWTDVNGLYTSDPNIIKKSELIKSVGYEQAQELAAMGAKVLHPYCILPCQRKNIPILIKNTYDANSIEFTTIQNTEKYINRLYAITKQSNVSVFNIKSINMWNNYGFVYDIFEKFNRNSIDINIINTSQFVISTTTDEKNINKLINIKNELLQKYEVELINDCSIISIVGDNIKNQRYLPNAIEISKKYKTIKMVQYSANDMTLSFVIDNIDANQIMKELHEELLIEEEAFNDNKKLENKWWISEIDKINNIMKNQSSAYIYNMDFINQQISFLKSNLSSISEIYYSMKANNHKNIINKIANNGIGFECVSINEIEYLRDNLFIENNIMFTPNFCNINEYIDSFKYTNIDITVDNIDLIKNNIPIFENKSIGLRIDLDQGDGHHKNVITEGKKAKFGCYIDDILDNISFLKKNNIKIVGLHSHRGSGIEDYNSWLNTAKKLIELSYKFNTIEWINLGGGFGVNDDNPIDFNSLNKGLSKLNTEIKFYIEPGRFLVSEAGILISKVTQIKQKDNINYIGLNTGMNSLIRPCLYGSYHKIHNLDKIYEKRNKVYNIVGPICETGDVLGHNRLLPETNINDIILIEHGGAYGCVMASSYNMRKPAQEIIL